jgi:hypothetical protein
MLSACWLAKNGKDEKKIDIFLRMEADYPK